MKLSFEKLVNTAVHLYLLIRSERVLSIVERAGARAYQLDPSLKT